jgi:hypothetical protein
MKAIEQIGAALRPPRRSGCTRDTPCCDFWNWGAGELRPACCTQHLLELTDFVHELLSRNEITHWADYGTLLGAIRGQEFIPWDDDVDFGVLEADAAAIFALEPEIISAGYALEIPEPTVIRVNYSPINEAHLDLFLWKEQDGMLLAEFDPSYDWPGLRGRTSFPKRYVEELETVRIHGRSLPAPSPVHDFLVEHRYGDDYMVPARPILRVWLRPEIGPEAMTPRVKEMLAEISEKDYHLADLTSRGRFGRTGLSERWHRAALPFAPAPQAVERYLAAIPPDERSETVAELAHSLAWLDLATEELTPPNPRGRARRAARVALRAKRRIFGQSGGPDGAGRR